MAYRKTIEAFETALQDGTGDVLTDARHLEAQRLRLGADSRGIASAHSSRANLLATPFPPPSGGGSGLSPQRVGTADISPSGVSIPSSTPGGVPLQPTPSSGEFGLSSSSPSGGVFLQQQTPPGGALAQPPTGGYYLPPPPRGAPATQLTSRSRAVAQTGSKRPSPSPDKNTRSRKRSSVASTGSTTSNSPVDSRGKQPQPRTSMTSRRSAASDSGSDVLQVAELPRNLVPQLPPFEVPQLKLYPSGSSSMVDLDQSELDDDKREVLKKWFAQYHDKDVKIFNAWFFKGLNAGNTCMSGKIIYKDTPKWKQGDNNVACEVCRGRQRPCIRAMNVVDARGNVTGRSLHVLPVEGEDPFGYIAP